MFPYDLARLQAAHDVVHATDEAFYRKVCRWYSNQFHTPLHTVLECKVLTWDEILTHYYEDYYNKIPRNQLIRELKDLLPEISKEEEIAEDEFIQNLLKNDQLKKQSLIKSQQKPVQTPQSQPSEIITKVFDVDENEEQ